MGKLIHVLAFAAFVFLEVILTDATTIAATDPESESCGSDDDSSSEEDYTDKIKCEKPNEVYDVCPASCPPRVCGIDERLILCSPQPKPGDPNCNKPACRCEDGSYRDNKGNCVAWDECPQCPNPNEVYDECFSPCLQGRCDYDPRLVRCAPPPKPGDPGCVAGCRCVEGYVRNEQGACVKEEECNRCPNKNEVYDQCFSPCLQKRCDYDPRLVRCAPPPKLGDPGCVAGCRCADGFVRNEKGACVREKECNKCPNPNEIYDQCFSPCLQKTCDYDSRLVKCAPPPKLGDPGCVAGCRCLDGYVRNRSGTCIKREKCTTCRGDDNAIPGCGVNCGKTCSDIGRKGPIACPLFCQLDGCDCKNGFYYDSNRDRCVRPKDCTPTCRANEVFSTCANGGCRRRKCTDLDKLIICVDPLQCKPGCICAEGYYQDAKGNCVSEEQCRSQNGCGGDINAISGCGVNCGKKCSDVGQPGPFACPEICILNGCDCKDGFYYDDIQKKCVRANQCTTCRANEVFSSCANGGCRRRKCTDIDGPILCIDPLNCEPGCICADGYYQDANGNCVTKQQCHSSVGCKGDKNAVPGCGTYCGKKCSDLGKTGPGICPLNCILDACDCKDGFYYDENKKRCVLPSECTLHCQLNEELSSCANGVCRVQDCNDKGKIPLCPPMIPDSCRLGCVCKMNFLRQSGVCIPEKECVGSQSTDPNEGTCDNAESQLVLLRQGSYDFTGKMLYQVMKANPGLSVVTSAVSVLTPLAQLGLYSRGNTFSEIIKILNLKTKQEIRCGFPLLLDSLQASEGTELSVGAKVYVKKEYNLTDSFKRDSKEIFRAEGESIDFNNAAQAAEIINKWVSGATKGKITELVSADLFDSFTRLVLANAIYFKGTWKKEFDSKNTKKANFYVDSKSTKKVDMMQQKSKMNYFNYADIDAQIVELPYKDGNITFHVILPNQKDGILNLVEKLQDGAILDRAVSTSNYETVNLFMPKFDISTKTNLKDVLKKIGVKTIFTENSQLDGMINPNEPLYVTAAIQKATITVDEKGSEAAAANAFVAAGFTSVRVNPPKEIYFRADHPYVYCIKVRKVLIFCGLNYG